MCMQHQGSSDAMGCNGHLRFTVRRGQQYFWILLLSALIVCYIVDRQLRYELDQLILSDLKYAIHVKDFSDLRECPSRLRVEHIERKCKNNNDWHDDMFEGNNVSKLHHLWVSDYHKLIYCDIPKAGSTTFKFLISMQSWSELANTAATDIHNYTFLRIHNVVPLKEYTVQEAKQRLSTYFKFIVVRHPFSRLISAYKDKIYPRGWYVNEYAQTINGYYGPGTTKTRISTNQFLQLIVRRNSDFDDPHWRTYYKLCFPCDINYDQILKLETIENDHKLITKRIFHSDHDAMDFPMLNNRLMSRGNFTEINNEFWQCSILNVLVHKP